MLNERRGAGTLRSEDIGSTVLLKAWVQRRRDHGGVIFLDLRDRTGVIQVVVKPELQPEAAAALSAVRSEWVIEVAGQVVARSAENLNAEIPTGGLEVLADRGAVLTRAEPLPIPLDGRMEAGEDLRLRYRYLDLRSADLQKNLMLRHRVVHEARNYFHDAGFIDVETPILTRSTPEGARDYLVPSRVHRGSFYALPQSPQLFKQLLMVAGFERYVQFARCFRDEDLRADRQPEFTQIDLEMSFPSEEEIFDLIEGLFRRIFPLSPLGIELPVPFPRLTYADAVARYGSDRPDLRFDLEIRDLTARLSGTGFRGFSEAAASGGAVRGFAVPGAAEASRKQVDGWIEIARRAGAAGVLTLKRKGGETIFQVKGALTPAEIDGAADALGLADGGLALLVAGPTKTVAAALGALRLELARTYGLIPAGHHSFLWVTDFPLFEWSPEGSRWDAMHHPFTSPDPRDLDLLATDPGKVRARAYDVVMDGTELGGGSIRIHDPEVQAQMFRLLGIDDAEAEARFGWFREALRYGAPPHGGIALGLDRIIMLLAGASSIRDVIAFPKTASAADLLTEAPSTVDSRQLAELGIRLAPSSREGDPT